MVFGQITLNEMKSTILSSDSTGTAKWDVTLQSHLVPAIYYCCFDSTKQTDQILENLTAFQNLTQTTSTGVYNMCEILASSSNVVRKDYLP